MPLQSLKPINPETILTSNIKQLNHLLSSEMPHSHLVIILVAFLPIRKVLREFFVFGRIRLESCCDHVLAHVHFAQELVEYTDCEFGVEHEVRGDLLPTFKVV
jgi:hypothetical protein